MTDEKSTNDPSIRITVRLRGALRENYQRSGLGATDWLENLFRIYQNMLKQDPVTLTDAERQVLEKCVGDSVLNETIVKYLHHEIEDCDNYQKGSEAAKSLYEKVKKATIAQRVALLESLRI